MTEQLRRMADEAFVEILAQRVVEKLLARQKQALVVYTGSNIGEAAALEAMSRLRGEGFTFRVLLSRGASGLLDVERLRSVLEPEKLWVETPEETPEALTARYDTILVPAMTVHTAAHVAACMADTPASAVILDGLMRGKNVVVNIDGCCPDPAERLKRGFHMTEPLKQALRNNLETLRSFGARLTTSGGLYDKTLWAVGGTTDPDGGAGREAGGRVPEAGGACPCPAGGQGPERTPRSGMSAPQHPVGAAGDPDYPTGRR